MWQDTVIEKCRTETQFQQDFTLGWLQMALSRIGIKEFRVIESTSYQARVEVDSYQFSVDRRSYRPSYGAKWKCPTCPAHYTYEDFPELTACMIATCIDFENRHKADGCIQFQPASFFKKLLRRNNSGR